MKSQRRSPGRPAAFAVLAGLLALPLAARAQGLTDAADQAGPAVKITPQIGHTQQIRRVSFTADGTRLVTAARDGMVKLWSVDTGTLLRTFGGHSSGVTALAV